VGQHRPELLSQPSCKTTPHPLRPVGRPSLADYADGPKTTKGQEWLRKHGRIAECSYTLSTRVEGKSWQQIRLLARQDVVVPWNVYSLQLQPA
jgi:hypothetical protein